MRWKGLNDGSIKTLLIHGLLVGNIAVAWFPGSARVSRAGFRRPAETNFPSNTKFLEKFAMTRTSSPAGEPPR